MKKHNCVFGMCVILKKWWLYSKRILFYLRREKKEEKKKKREWQRGGPMGGKKKSQALSMGPTIFNLFTKRPFNNITWKVKTDLDGFLKYMFKYPNLRIVTQTPIIKHRYQTLFFFFWATKQALSVLNTNPFSNKVLNPKILLNLTQPQPHIDKFSNLSYVI